jgi:NUMOD3 motif-containing protein
MKENAITVGAVKTYRIVTKQRKPYSKWYHNPSKENTCICGKCLKNLEYHNALPPIHVRRSIRMERIGKRICYKCGGKTTTQKSKTSSHHYHIWHRHPIVAHKWLCGKCYANAINEPKRKFETKEERYAYLSKRLSGPGNPFFGRRHAEETRRKISLKKIGKPLSDKARVKMIGRPLTADTRAKISLKMRGRRSPMKGRHHSSEAKLRIAIANGGRVISEDMRKRLSDANKGDNNPMYGKHHSEETKRKISESTKDFSNPFFGKHHADHIKRSISEKNKGKPAWNKGLGASEETRRTLSISHIGIYPSKETLLKRSKSLTGLMRKPISENTRMKMSRVHSGKKLSEETRMKMRKCQLNEHAFSTPLTPKVKYWVGFLIADGNVSIKKGIPIIALHLQETDKDQIEKFRTFVGSTHKIGRYVNKKTGRVSYSISFSCEIMANDIAKYGVVTKKWFIVKVKGGLENDRDLWRGIVDGDGYIAIYPRKTSNGTVRPIPYISLTGNLYICLQFKAFLEHQIGLSMPDIVPYKNSYQISVSDHRAVRAIKLLYEDCAVALDRKLKVAKKILETFLLQGNSYILKRV